MSVYEEIDCQKSIDGEGEARSEIGGYRDGDVAGDLAARAGVFAARLSSGDELPEAGDADRGAGDG